MKLKVLVLSLLLIVPLYGYEATGFKVSYVSVENVSSGVGVGFLGLYELSNIFYVNPSIDFLYAFENRDVNYYYENGKTIYVSDHSLYEFAFNLDVLFVFPTDRVQPFLGFGLAPVLTIDNYRNYDDLNMCFNIIGGILFSGSMIELRGKIAPDGYDVLKLSFCFLFGEEK